MKQEVIKDNIQAALYLSRALETTFGPNGMDKLLIDNLGDSYVTNNAAVIIENIELKHPIAKIVAEAGSAMSEEVGDGSATAIILTGSLLKQAQKLIEKGLHPTTIIKGYQLAHKQVIKKLGQKAQKVEEKHLRSLVQASLRNELLTNLVLDATAKTSTTNAAINKTKGLINDSKVISGLIIDKTPVHPRMPKQVRGARVLITKTPLEVRNTDTDAEISINNPLQLKEFKQDEVKVIKKIVNQVIESGANVILCQRGIDERAQELLARKRIMVIRRIREKDIKFLLKATGANLIADFNEIRKDDLGFAGIIKVMSDEEQTIIKACPGKIKTVIIKANNQQLIDEYENKVKKGIKLIRTIKQNPFFVKGRGIIENELSSELEPRKGRESLGIKAYAKALRAIPETLAKNKGLNSEDIIEPVKIKEQAITSATETAITILRIDDILKGK